MVSRSEIRQAITAFRSEETIVNISDISGQNRETYDVKISSGENLICCFNKDKPEWFKIEESLVSIVDEETDVPTQNILYSDFSRENIPQLFHIAEKIGGSKSEEKYAELPLDQKEEVVRQIGGYLAEIHDNIRFENFGKFRYRNGGLDIEEFEWRDLIQEIAEDYIDSMEGTRFEDLQEEFREYVQKNLHLLDESNPVLVHYDVAVDNVIREGSNIKAILDWERAFVGRPEWDLAYSEVRFILQFLDNDEDIERLKQAFYQSYQKVKPLREGWRKRKEYYGMIQLFQGMKYFENWTDRKSYSEDEKIQEEEWHRNHFRKNNRKL